MAHSLVDRLPTRYEVLLTQGAEQDLKSIHDYISEFHRLMGVADGPAEFSERGSYAKELVAMAIKDYRQMAFKPYRVIYRVLGSQVVIYLIVDDRA